MKLRLLVTSVGFCSLLASANVGAEVPASTGTLEEVVVTGFRASLQTAIESKREAASISDTISAEDIGKFPELNLAESLQRITGVQITRNNGEGQFVSIRGLPPNFALVNLNGRDMPSPPRPGPFGSRSFDFSIITADFVNAVDVYKAPTADLNEGGLSGTVNVRTLNPADVTARKFVVSAKGSYNSNTATTGPRLSGIYEDTLADGRLGVVAGASYSKRDILNLRYQAYGLQPTMWWPGSTGAGPTNFPANAFWDNAQEFDALTGQDERTTYLAALSLKVNSSADLYAQYLNSSYSVDQVSNGDVLRFAGGAGAAPAAITAYTLGRTITEPLPGTTGVTGQIIDSLTATGIDYRNNARTGFEDDKLRQYAVGLNFRSGPWSGNVDLSDAKSSSALSNLALEATGFASASSTIGSGPATWTFAQGYNPLDPTQFHAASFNGAYKQPAEDEIKAAKFEVKYKNSGGFIRGVTLGLRLKSEENSYQTNSVLLDGNSLAAFLGVPAQTYGNGCCTGPNIAPYMSQITHDFWGNVHTYLVSDLNKLYAQFPLAQLIQAAGGAKPNLGTAYDIKEDTYAGYARLDFGAEHSPFTGNIGLRVVKTDETSNGYAPDLNNLTCCVGVTPTVPAAGPASVKNSYVNVLPSLNLSWDASDDLKFRFGAARTLTRPDLASLSPAVNAVTSIPWSINKGNPNLHPYTSDSLDLSAEWYFAKGGLLSAAAFYKSISGFIQTLGNGTETHNVTQNGVTAPEVFAIFQPVNAGKTTANGFEISYQQSFSFLPKPFDGTGIVANYTYVNAGDITFGSSAASSPMAGVSKSNYTVVAYYEGSRFGIRADYTYRGSYLSSQPDNYFGDGDYIQGYGQLDMSSTFHLTSRFDVTLEAFNLGNKALSQLDIFSINRGYESDGRTILLGVRAKY
ncbi:MAG TPA: TonB-dependent receptor [Steroidobacteraceae bacterium]|nr:TonB-dependent receptor [Steroidobacteraceae bacterium]